MTTTNSARLIEQRLRDHLEAVHVEVIDDSARHADHLGAQGGGGNFRVVVVSARFEGLSRVAAQRLVYATLNDLMKGAIHALQMQTLTPRAWRDMSGTGSDPNGSA
jgi:BolA protein